MRTLLSRFMVFCAFVAATATLVFVFSPSRNAVRAQDEMGIVCDSTLAILLLVAEHDYGYVSSMMAEMPESVPNLDLGQYDPLIRQTAMMMMAQQEMMTEEEVMAAQAMEGTMMEMMMMSDTDLINSFYTATGMEAIDFTTLTTLAPGDVEGQDATCATVRAGVQQFLLTHIIADMNMSMSMMEGQ